MLHTLYKKPMTDAETARDDEMLTTYLRLSRAGAYHFVKRLFSSMQVCISIIKKRKKLNIDECTDELKNKMAFGWFAETIQGAAICHVIVNNNLRYIVDTGAELSGKLAYGDKHRVDYTRRTDIAEICVVHCARWVWNNPASNNVTGSDGGYSKRVKH